MWTLTRLCGFVALYIAYETRGIHLGSIPSFLKYLNIWDAKWYQKIYSSGYPHELDINPSTGVVAMNTWPFMPLYPLLIKCIAFLGLPYEIVSVLLLLFFSYVFAYLLYYISIAVQSWKAGGSFSVKYFQELYHKRALLFVLLVGMYVTSPILNVGYAESLTLCLLAAWIIASSQKKYFWAMVIALFASESRPVGVPLGAAAGLLWFFETLSDWRTESGMSIWDALVSRYRQLVYALLTCGFAFIYPIYAALVTGHIDAYHASELGWSGRTVGNSHMFIVQWGNAANFYSVFNKFIWLLVAIIVFSIFFIWLSSKRASLNANLVIRVWLASYAGYLLLFWLPQYSTFRILMPLFPLFLYIAHAKK